MSTNNMVSPQEQLPIDEITSPLGDQIFEFCESELFPETLQNSEVASSSNCCYEEHSSYQTPLSITLDNNEIRPPPVASNLPLMFMEDQSIEDDISASIDFNLSPSNFAVPPPPPPDHHHQYYNTNHHHQEVGLQMHEGALYGQQQQQAAYNMRMRNSEPVMGSYNLANMNNNAAAFSFDHSWLFTGGASTAAGLSFEHQEMLESHHDNNSNNNNNGGGGGPFFMPDSLARVFNCSTADLQTLSSESQHLLGGSPGTTLASEISSLEDPTFKVGKISAEERKRKINRYLKKRNERNFSKKIKYACRKTLADSRPRVRGRFAKNDELGELARSASTGHDDDVDDDVTLFSNHIPDHHHKVVKEEGSMGAIDMYGNINEVNSFKCSTYPIQSWIN